MIRTEIIDVRYVTKVFFLCLTSYNFGNTFDAPWLGIPFAFYFLFIGCLNATKRRDFSRRPKYRKLPAYLAIVPLALFWFLTPGVEQGVNPSLVFIPGTYLLFLTALQERSRGNGGFEAFVNFNGLAVLLASSYHGPRGSAIAVLVGLILLLISSSRRGTSFYKYLLFLLLVAALGMVSFAGWNHWKKNRGYGNGWNGDSVRKTQMMGFDPIASLGSFGKSYNSKFNNQVVLRVWDDSPPKYMVAARYATYAGGVWKLPQRPLKTMEPAYYQVDYSVMEVADSVTRSKVKKVWVQSTLDNFGFLFAPNGAVGFSAKDLDSLHYFPGGMVTGLDKKGPRSDWNYFVCVERGCGVPQELSKPDSSDLHLLPLYEGLVDSVIDEMKLRDEKSLKNNGSVGLSVLHRIQEYFNLNFSYSLQVPELEKQNIRTPRTDPLHVFWKNKKGYCEYYASLSVLTLRRLGYPARYVTGFARPEVTPGSPYAIYRRKQAHSWVEVYIDGMWYIFDSTPVVFTSPESEASSWLANFWEGSQARFAKWLHYLKDGEWRSSLDSWQARVESATESPVLYILLIVLSGGFLGRRIYIAKKRKSRTISAKSLQAKVWAKKLTQAEYLISRVGLERYAGETVGQFLLRIKDEPLKGKAASARDLLKEYEKSRWTL